MQSPAPQYNNQVGRGPSPQPGPSSNDLGPMPPSRDTADTEKGTKVSGFGIWEGCHSMFLIFIPSIQCFILKQTNTIQCLFYNKNNLFSNYFNEFVHFLPIPFIPF